MKAFAIAMLALLMALASCTSPALDEAAVRKAATDHYMTAPHEGDNPPVDVLITSIKPTTHEARAGWEVAISGRIILAGLPEGYLAAMVLFVDDQSGAVTVIAGG